MHIPSERIYNEMRSEIASLWYVPATGDDEFALLIKAPTSSIKSLVAGCSVELCFGKSNSFLCVGARILDTPNAPLFISSPQHESEEHNALIRMLTVGKFPVFLFSEMDICLAWTYIEIAPKDSLCALNFIGQEKQLYVGSFTKEASHVLDCFCISVDKTAIYPKAYDIPILEVAVRIENWQANNLSFVSNHDYQTITIDEKNEGEIFERTIWACLTSVFPSALYKSPQVKIGDKVRELTDILAYYHFGSFLIEAKDLSILQAGYQRSQERKITGVQKQVNKAIHQLIGASKAYSRGDAIFDIDGEKLLIDRVQPPHCIVLITELMHCGDWSEIEALLFEAMHVTGSFFHLLDLREFIALLKGSSGKPELVDYNLMQRCKLCIEGRSIFVRSE